MYLFLRAAIKNYHKLIWNNRNLLIYSLTVLEAASRKLRCQQDCFPLGVLRNLYHASLQVSGGFWQSLVFRSSTKERREGQTGNCRCRTEASTSFWTHPTPPAALPQATPHSPGAQVNEVAPRDQASSNWNPQAGSDWPFDVSFLPLRTRPTSPPVREAQCLGPSTLSGTHKNIFIPLKFKPKK